MGIRRRGEKKTKKEAENITKITVLDEDDEREILNCATFCASCFFVTDSRIVTLFDT